MKTHHASGGGPKGYNMNPQNTLSVQDFSKNFPIDTGPKTSRSPVYVGRKIKTETGVNYPPPWEFHCQTNYFFPSAPGPL